MRDKSDENWKVGVACLNGGQVNAAASRLYYALFQVVYQYAQDRRNYRNEGKGGVHAAMAQVVGDVINDKRASGTLYRRLQVLRETADYDREPADSASLQAILSQAERLRGIFIRKNSEN